MAGSGWKAVRKTASAPLVHTSINGHTHGMTEVSTTAIFVLLACAALAERLLPTSSLGSRVIPLMFALAAVPCAFTTIELPVSSMADRSILLGAVLVIAGDGVLRYWRPAKAPRGGDFGGS